MAEQVTTLATPTMAEPTSAQPRFQEPSVLASKYRANSDNLEQIQQDFRRAVVDMEARLKLMLDELKRAVG